MKELEELAMYVVGRYLIGLHYIINEQNRKRLELEESAKEQISRSEGLERLVALEKARISELRRGHFVDLTRIFGVILGDNHYAVFLDSDGRVVNVTSPFAGFLGYSSSEMIGQSYANFIEGRLDINKPQKGSIETIPQKIGFLRKGRKKTDELNVSVVAFTHDDSVFGTMLYIHKTGLKGYLERFLGNIKGLLGKEKGLDYILKPLFEET